MRNLCALAALAVSACAVTDPVVLKSPKREPAGWISVSFTVKGETNNTQSLEECLDEARAAGISLVEGAPRSGTLILDDRERNYFEMPGSPRYVIEEASPRTACRLALARLVDLDALVRVAKADAPEACKMLGRASGTDEGWMGRGSLAAAVAEAQFKVRAQGGNLYVQDLVEEEISPPPGAPPGTRLAYGRDTEIHIDGRAYRCPD